MGRCSQLLAGMLKRFNASNVFRRFDEVQEVENGAGRSECDTERREWPRGAATTMIGDHARDILPYRIPRHWVGAIPWHWVGAGEPCRAAYMIQRH